MLSDDVIVTKGTTFHPTLYELNVQRVTKHLNTGDKQYIVTDEVSVFGTKYCKGMYVMVKNVDVNMYIDWTFANILFALVFGDEVNFVVRLCSSSFDTGYGIII